jgi:NADPH2:quinone reductase
VVYDSIGATTFTQSLDSLQRRGLLVCFGTASGPIPPINAMQLAVKGSLFVTRPALADYIADEAERAELAGELFDHVGSGRITVEINQRYALEDAVQAHRDLESGRTIGSSVFSLEAAGH